MTVRAGKSNRRPPAGALTSPSHPVLDPLPLLPSESPYPRPDWNAISLAPEAQSQDPTQLNAFWTDRGREWVHQLRQALGASYVGYESTHFWLVSSQPAETSRRLVLWAESVRKRVLQALALASEDSVFGKCPILVVHDRDVYYDYIAAYYPDGEHGGSGGVYLNDGYGHFVFTYLDMNPAESILAHELAHALVAHLRLPRWIDEGIAQTCEQAVTGRAALSYDEVRDTIDTYWTPETIQGLWDGSGFGRTDAGQIQSYHLAKVLTQRLMDDIPRFREFLREASDADVGAAALQRHYGVTLAELVSDYLGPGEWAPNPANGRPAEPPAN